MTTIITPYGWKLEVAERPGVTEDDPHLLAAFSRRTAIPSFITRTLTGGARWSHCGVVDVQRGVVIEAQVWHGVVETPIGEWLHRYPSMQVIRIPCPCPSLGLKFAHAQLGKGYDYWAWAVPWRAPWQSEARWYCSELLEAAIMAAGRSRFIWGKRGVSPMDCWWVR